VIYGDRALDLAFDFGGIAGGAVGETDFDMAKFFGEKAPIRISTLSSERMVHERLLNLFGEDPQFTMEMALIMKETMLTDLTVNRKEEYMSAVGIALLFDRSGGKLTAKMADVIEKAEVKSVHAQQLIEECRDTLKALKAINMDNDDHIDWNEFLVYLKWAMHQYPSINDVDELLSVAFRKGIIPAMQDELSGGSREYFKKY
ncbi:hypothetical protein OS493_038822, partial [Desmophyllum pertusum]